LKPLHVEVRLMNLDLLKEAQSLFMTLVIQWPYYILSGEICFS